MNLLKKNICIYISVGIFLLPHIFNNLHFVLVSHDFHWEFQQNSDKISFKSKDEFHNCEQYIFKVPPATQVDLFEEILIVQYFQFREISEKEIKILSRNINLSPHKRGPPDLI